MDLFLRSGQDPFVMMSWRCKNLEEIVIHGYVLDPHNIVGISRLRGHNLKRLEVSMIDNIPTEPNMESFIEVCIPIVSVLRYHTTYLKHSYSLH